MSSRCESVSPKTGREGQAMATHYIGAHRNWLNKPRTMCGKTRCTVISFALSYGWAEIAENYEPKTLAPGEVARAFHSAESVRILADICKRCAMQISNKLDIAIDAVAEGQTLMPSRRRNLRAGKGFEACVANVMSAG